MYCFLEQVDPGQHDAFVQTNAMCNLLQSASWAKVKENWDHAIVGVKEGDHLVASALVLIKRLPLHFTMFYIPRGPVMDYQNKELVCFFMKHLQRWAKKHHCLFIKMDPGIHYRDYLLEEKEEAQVHEEIAQILENMKEAGAIHQGLSLSIKDSIQPRFQANVYKEENIRELFSKHARKGLSIAEKKHVQIRLCGEEAVARFAQVLHCTEERKGISLRDQEYFKKLLEAYPNDSIICLAVLPVRKLYEESVQKLNANEQALAACPENAKKKRFTLEEQHSSYMREVSELKELLEKNGEEITIAGGLCIKYGHTAELLYAGMDERFKRYMPSYAVFTACMEWGFESGCDYYNMGGIEGSLQDGLTKFKANFHPHINEFIGEFDLPVSHLLYHASQKAYTIRKRRMLQHNEEETNE